ncbi:MAG: IS256 family transposase [Candidatus Omnitrophota bacterium]|nr:IS256 family transposase [Candidatus Omnitrophota bacterium]
MSKAVDFSKANVSVNWKYVKRNFREMGILTKYVDSFERRAQGAIKDLIQGDIYEEFEEQIGATRYERADTRQDSRKGEYERFLATTFGRARLQIPRTRGKVKIRYTLFDKYQRRRKKFDEMIVMSMILGLSTRKQKKFFKAFIGDAVSHGMASRLMGILDKSLSEYRTRKIRDDYKYLLVDGIWIHVKESSKVKNRPVIVIMGIRMDNVKEILAFKLARGESEAAVTPILNDLYRRGLKGANLKIVASDGAKGIKAAIEMVYPYAKWQLCSTHKLRNLCANIEQKAKNRKKMLKEASKIYESATRKEAITRFNRFCRRWEKLEKKAVRHFAKDFGKTLTFYNYAEDRNFISTTNHLERDLEEIRRRIKTQGYFKNERSVDYWVYGILKYSERIRQPEGVMPEEVKEPEYESVHNS